MKYLFCLLLALPSLSSAQEAPSDLGTQVPVAAPAESPALPRASTEKFILGLHTVDFNYQEPGLMSDRGWLAGVAFQYHRLLSDDRLLKVAADYAQGSTLYNGALQTNTGNTTPYSSTEQFRVINLELILGNSLSDRGWAMTVGGGYRNTYDNKSGPYDYRRDITYYYLLVGLNSRLYDGGKIKSILNLEFSSLLGGGAKTYLSDVSSSYKDVNFAFKYGSALKVGVETTLPVFNEKEVLVDLSYKYWTLSDSKIEYVGNGSYGVEPHNNTALTSITVGYIF